MKNKKFSTPQRLKSFVYAFNGLKILIREEHNSRIHFVIAIVVTIAGFILEISVEEWIAIVIAIGFVIAAEIFNSSIENIADFISPEKHEKIKKIKDLAAAGVLISALTALTIGLIIFLPKIIEF
ncbi:MAG TPA: diacylglycerol kinase family protein [Chryseolinea sp.]|nr:diacylglycerol kinase family protein [Flavobacteriales bacterium]HPH46311.1 diacylglycerol kinase family protein [Chryseolinea sp.]HPM31562.1 diacylglycerol kinase family protein [Chryseolinea sp.]